jgi:hypothetical protein
MSDTQALSLEGRFSQLGSQLLETQKLLMDLRGRLAERIDPDLEADALVLRTRRDELIRAWGLTALAWQIEGGIVELRLPSSGSLGPPADSVEIVPELEPGGEDEEGESVDASILESVVFSPSWAHARPEPTFDIDAVSSVATRLGPPISEMTDENRIAEAAALDAELNRVNLWASLPKTIQRALVGLVVARMRALQDDSPSHVRALLERQLRKGFARLTQFSSDYQPGWVAGLSRSHRPESGSWFGDADFWWKALGRELGGFVLDAERAALNPEVALNELTEILRDTPKDVHQIRRVATRALNAGVSPEDGRLTSLLLNYIEALEGDKALKKLRRAVRKAKEDTLTVMPEAMPADELPEDWPFFDRTRDRRAVIVGGDIREERRAAIQEAFGFSSVEWIDGGDTRAIQSLAHRVEGNRVDLVLLLARFISHKVTDILLPACRANQTDWVMVRKGYGLNQLRIAIERYLADNTKTVPVAPIRPV